MSEDQPTGRGGKRPGAGRKEGTKNIRTAAIGRQLAKKELTPLHILVETMTAFWEQAQRTVETQPKLALMREASPKRPRPTSTPACPASTPPSAR